MNTLQFTFLSLLLTGPVLLADPAAVVSAPAADPIAEALPILQAKYVDFQSLNYKPSDKLEDLIARSNGGICLVAPNATTPTPIITTTLPDGILYWRLASFGLPPGKGWPDMVAQPHQADVRGIILDLRSNMTPDDYEGAIHIRNLFGPNYPIEEPTATTPKDQNPITQRFPFPRIVLTNHQTTGAAEALAEFLQADGALVVGRATAGRVGAYQECKLSSGQILRYAVASTTGCDPAAEFEFRSETPTWNRPVVPDIALTEDEHTEKAALMLIRDDHILDVIQESAERHRMSEASLVQGQDPEWDQYLASLEKGPVLLSLPTIHDNVLISALDSLKAIQFSQRPAPAQATASVSPPASTSIQ